MSGLKLNMQSTAKDIAESKSLVNWQCVEVGGKSR